MRRQDKSLYYAVISSALLLGAAHWWPAYCGWFVFIFLIPLFYVALQNTSQLSFASGFLWGVIFFSMHLAAVLHIIVERGTTIIRYPLMGILIIYCAAHSGFWFWCATTSSKLQIHSITWRCCCWAVATLLFWHFMYRHGLWITGDGHGYFGALLWLPLAYCRQWLAAVPVIGVLWFSAMLILGALACSVWIRYGERIVLILVFIIGAVFAYGWFSSENLEVVPAWYDQLCWIPPQWRHNTHPLARAHAISDSLQKAVQLYPEARIFLLPESTCPFALNNYEHVITWWWNDVVPDDAWIILGGFRREGKKLYNTLYSLHESRVSQHYDKILLTPMTEYLPSLWKRLLNKKLRFLLSIQSFCTPSSNMPMIVSAWTTFFPYICSDLFLNTVAPNLDQGNLQLCLVNDSWFSLDYMPLLMCLYARIRAMESGGDCIYISHERGVYITSYGSMRELKNIND